MKERSELILNCGASHQTVNRNGHIGFLWVVGPHRVKRMNVLTAVLYSFHLCLHLPQHLDHGHAVMIDFKALQGS